MRENVFKDLKSVKKLALEYDPYRNIQKLFQKSFNYKIISYKTNREHRKRSHKEL